MSAGLDPQGIRDLMRRNIVDLFATGDADLIPEVYAEDVVDHNPVPGQRAGHDGLRDVLAAFHTAFPDQVMELHGTLADGEYGVDFWTFRGTHRGPLGTEGAAMPATGRRVTFSGIDVARIRDGRIAEIWHVEDMATMWAQLRETAQPPNGAP